MRALLACPRTVLVAVLAVTVLLGTAAVRGLVVDNSIDAWLPSGDADVDRYEDFREVFGADQFLVVAADGLDADTPAVRAAVGRLATRLSDLDGVDLVVAPGETGRAGGLVAADGRAIGVLVFTEPRSDASGPGSTVEAIETAFAEAQLGGVELLAGPEAVNHYLDVGSQEEFAQLFPIVVGVIALVLLAALRAIRPVVGILLVAAVSSTWVLGLVALTGRPLNMVLSTLPALLVVLSTAYSLHVVAAYRLADDATPRERWAHALRDTVAPCALTAFTTFVGFLALAVADILPVRDLGVFAGLGALVACGLVFTLLPALLLVAGGAAAPAGSAKSRGRPGRSFAAVLQRGRYVILGTAAVLAVVAVIGMTRLRIESHILSFFHPAHPVVQATHRIEDRLVGLTAIDVWMHGDRETVVAAPTVRALRDLAAFCADEPDVLDVRAPVVSSRRLRDLDDEAAAAHLRATLPVNTPLHVGDRLRATDDRADVRMTVTTRTTSIEESEALLGRLEERLAGVAPVGVTAVVTGSIPLLVRIQALLLRTQIETFGIAMALVTGLLAIAFRSLSLALCSLVPNVLPVLLTLGTMGFLDIPLDVATVTVASVALGLVVDDTIHFLSRLSRSAQTTAVGRIDEVLRTTGRPILLTSLATAVGFCAFAFSPFRPVAYFGVLIALTAAFALVCDLVVLPAALLLRR